MRDKKQFVQGQVVCHPKYGKGIIIVGGETNIAVRFDNGGPVGFATDATNDVAELQVLS